MRYLISFQLFNRNIGDTYGVTFKTLRTVFKVWWHVRMEKKMAVAIIITEIKQKSVID